MKRRNFLKTTGLAAAAGGAGASFLRAEPGTALRYAAAPKLEIRLALGEAEEAVAAVAAETGGLRALFGGPVLSKLAGKNPRWTNGLVECSDLPALKRNLFRAGVTPLSTPEMPAHFIKFRHRDQVFNLLATSIDQLCQRNHTLAQGGVGVFAHHFLIYEPDAGTLYDPRGAAPGDGEQAVIRMCGEPYGLMRSLDCVFTGEFESLLLSLELSEPLRNLRRFVLDQNAREKDEKFVVERVLNYLPEFIELAGFELARPWLQAPLTRGAFRSSLRLDLAQVDAELAAEKESGLGVDGAVFMARVNRKMGVRDWERDFGSGVNHYMACNGFDLRRTDLLRRSLYLT